MFNKSDVEEIVLVGGSGHIPKVEQQFVDYSNGMELVEGVDQAEALTKGAGIQGRILSGAADDFNGSCVMYTAASLSLGIETADGLVVNLIHRHTIIQIQKAQNFTTYKDNQTSVIIRIFEGERVLATDNRLLGQLELTDLASAPAGVPQIEVTFDTDYSDFLRVSAVNKRTGSTEKTTITPEAEPLSMEEIDRMIEEAAQFSKLDEKIKEDIEHQSTLKDGCDTV